ncbi:PREDICTED: interleukin-20 receptor subunit alpha [Chrysochloris asiatica]|uniref:Interleukin-20 receptor subunit alpha n=1 Tax=Chrysochloris asiatica TaxID=185453 RepID=A0A9B0T395_CHRAS|nr:PREDICTED: interleukin-20 receptor subunit alpha [Chrysochloris asiatica]
MKNVLQWNPPEGLTGFAVSYTVQYFIYGQKKWLEASECRKINRTYCDLSAETSDYEQQYYGKVKAIWKTNCSKWTETRRFYPYLETQIGPPAVALSTDEKSLSIVLTAPEKWKRSSEEGFVSMQEIYPTLKYTVSVYNAKSNRTWLQYETNHSLVLSWLQPDTLYCVHVESLVPGPPRQGQPSEKQCVSTLKDRTLELKIKIILYYVLPISICVVIFFVMGYSMYRYIHVGKEKQPENLILVYENEFDKRFFVPAEKIGFSFIVLNILDDSEVSQKDLNLTEKNSDVSDPNDSEPSKDPEPQQEEDEVKHFGYASHLMEISCDSGENTNGASLTHQESFLQARATDETVIEYEYNVKIADISMGPGNQELNLQEEVCMQGNLFEQQAPLANLAQQTVLYPYAAQLRVLDHLTQELPDQEGPEEEPSTTLVDWDPQTGRLCIPSLSDFEHDSESYGSSECGGGTDESLLFSLYEEQAPDKLLEENETYLMQFLKEWELFVQMEG